MNPLGVWGYVGAAVIAGVLALAGTHYVDAAVYGKQIAAIELVQSKAQTANVTASLTQLQGFIANMHTADAGYNASLDGINNALVVIKKEFNNATHVPLPPDCKPDAGRLRVLTDAVSAANKAAAAVK